MAHEASEGLPVAARLALLTLIGVILLFHAVPSSYSLDPQKAERMMLDITISSPTPPPSTVGWDGRFLTPDNLSLAGLICLIPLLFLLLALRILRQKIVQPTVPPTVPTVPHLESVGALDGPHYFDLQPGGSTIGRGPENDLVVTQDFAAWETVSRRHARIYRQTGYWIVEDLGATNGIYVNGKRTGRNLLRDGWRLGIGGVEFIFNVGTEEARR